MHEILSLARRKSADEPEIEQPDFAIGESKDVAGVWIAVEDAFAKDHIEGDRENRLGHLVRLWRIGFDCRYLFSDQLAHDEYVISAQIGEWLGEDELGAIGVFLREIDDIGAFIVEIELGDDRFFEIGDEVWQVEIGELFDACVECFGEYREDVDVASDEW